MSRIVGDAMVGGPEAAFAPEYVTVRLTRGQAEVLAVSAEHMLGVMPDAGEEQPSRSDIEFLSRAIDAIRAQIGGAR